MQKVAPPQIVKTVRLAWNTWREVTVVIYDKKVPVKIFKTVIKPTVTQWGWMLDNEKERR